ncbi:hypothetical protein HPB48_014899 [Haemaphysalis longicornis]|uniref:Uncharacterized protein n=1 Tax=Haemaphysalis longicornis TaxID=44386 RepID=A0A9J6GAM6_HAELO|nr:hypothetical protein HPB48_014899 [Haemaphysalis longicornis]
MPLPLYHYFNVRVPSGLPVDAVIDTAEAIVPPTELYSVQHMGDQIGVNASSGVRKFLDTNGLRIENDIINLEPADKQYVSIAFFFPANLCHGRRIGQNPETLRESPPNSLRSLQRQAVRKDRPAIRKNGYATG